MHDRWPGSAAPSFRVAWTSLGWLEIRAHLSVISWQPGLAANLSWYKEAVRRFECSYTRTKSLTLPTKPFSTSRQLTVDRRFLSINLHQKDAIMRLCHKSTIPACYSFANVAIGPEDSYHWIKYIKLNNSIRQSYQVNGLLRVESSRGNNRYSFQKVQTLILSHDRFETK